MADVTESCRRFPELKVVRLWMTFDGPVNEEQVRATVYGIMEPMFTIERINWTSMFAGYNVMVYLKQTGDIDNGPVSEDAGSVHSL